MFLVVITTSTQASPVNISAAQKLATNFFSQHTNISVINVTLAHTETSSSGDALYYVFNINSNDGYIIISADNAAHPVIGYGTNGQYSAPPADPMLPAVH